MKLVSSVAPRDQTRECHFLGAWCGADIGKSHLEGVLLTLAGVVRKARGTHRSAFGI